MPGQDVPHERPLRYVLSADGTAIAVERVTSGPRALVTMAGGTTGRRSWAGVAGRLDGTLACWLMDRRGKGDSGDTAPYSFAREHEDVAAVVAAVGGDGPVLAAHSSAAVCLLGAVAIGLPAQALVIYEPPWPLGIRPSLDAVYDEMDALVAAGDRDAALSLGLRALVELPPSVVEGMRGTPGWSERLANVHVWPREGREIDRIAAGTAALSAIDVPVLLLDGEQSPDHLRRATAAVAAALPRSVVVTLRGQHHAALGSAPGLVADAVRDFVT